jgi:hypothetical protein
MCDFFKAINCFWKEKKVVFLLDGLHSFFSRLPTGAELRNNFFFWGGSPALAGDNNIKMLCDYYWHFKWLSVKEKRTSTLITNQQCYMVRGSGWSLLPSVVWFSLLLLLLSLLINGCEL